MLAFCFHFPTFMDIICCTVVSTATHLDRLNINPNKMTEENCFQKCLRQQDTQLLWCLTEHTCEVAQHAGEALRKGSTRALLSKGIWPCTEECHQPSVTSSYLSAPASKFFFTAVHRSSECQKPRNPRGTSWHKNGENTMSPGPCTWRSRHHVENRSRVNKPGDFQKAYPKSVKQVLSKQTILLLLWKEAELLGKCLYLCKPQKWRVITENQFHYSKIIGFPLISAFLFRICW